MRTKTAGSRAVSPAQFRLKDSVYALAACEPEAGLYFSISGDKPKLKPLPLATLAPATSHCRRELVKLGIDKLAGQACELVRVDA